VLQEMVLAERHARERLKRIETAIAELLPSWSVGRHAKPIRRRHQEPSHPWLAGERQGV
jgi:hypothetical protein